jgi:hypothetical protein
MLALKADQHGRVEWRDASVDDFESVTDNRAEQGLE